jgi:hypothetical protein
VFVAGTATAVGTDGAISSCWTMNWSMFGGHFVGTVVTMNCWTIDVAVKGTKSIAVALESKPSLPD